MAGSNQGRSGRVGEGWGKYGMIRYVWEVQNDWDDSRAIGVNTEKC